MRCHLPALDSRSHPLEFGPRLRRCLCSFRHLRAHHVQTIASFRRTSLVTSTPATVRLDGNALAVLAPWLASARRGSCPQPFPKSERLLGGPSHEGYYSHTRYGFTCYRTLDTCRRSRKNDQYSLDNCVDIAIDDTPNVDITNLAIRELLIT